MGNGKQPSWIIEVGMGDGVLTTQNLNLARLLTGKGV
jgi:16S rRNA A1518/A1519 N6-dimethyltransferase RsmA/KsgA/DIM1 with predicted DNA glycosylase/AP lyase activity